MEAIGKGYSSKWGKNSSSEERLKFLYTAYSGTKYTPQKKKGRVEGECCQLEKVIVNRLNYHFTWIYPYHISQQEHILSGKKWHFMTCIKIQY